VSRIAGVDGEDGDWAVALYDPAAVSGVRTRQRRAYHFSTAYIWYPSSSRRSVTISKRKGSPIQSLATSVGLHGRGNGVVMSREDALGRWSLERLRLWVADGAVKRCAWGWRTVGSSRTFSCVVDMVKASVPITLRSQSRSQFVRRVNGSVYATTISD
jgi:hypothetical protein